MRLSWWTVPALVLVAAAVGVGAARLLEAPTVVREYRAAFRGEPARTVLKVRGLKCTDTAVTFARLFDGVPGVLRLEAFAADHEARIAYDPALTDPSALRAAAEEPVVDPESGAISFGVYEVLEVDGTPIVPAP